MEGLLALTDRVLLQNVDTSFYRPGEPFHIHTQPLDGKQWACSSPYCEYLGVNMPGNGGPPVIMKGLEPWRGR